MQTANRYHANAPSIASAHDLAKLRANYNAPTLSRFGTIGINTLTVLVIIGTLWGAL